METKLNNGSPQPNIADNESGLAGLLALFSIAILCIYIKYDQIILQKLFGDQVTPLLSTIVVVILSVMVLFSICCAIHMKFIGDRSNRSLIREIRSRVNQINMLISTSYNHLKRFEEEMVSHAGVMTPRAIDCTAVLKRILKALELRASHVQDLVASGDKIDLFDAYELLNKRLKVSTSALDSLIDSDPVPDLEPAEWAPAIEKLLDGINFELRRVA